MSKQKTQFNKSSTKAIISLFFEILTFIATVAIALIVKIDSKQQIWVYVLAGVLMLFMVVLMYCSYCGLRKKQHYKDPNSFENEYERRYFQDAKPEKKKISSAEYLRRLEEQKNKKG